MKKPTASQKIIDRFEGAIENERLQERFAELLGESPFSRFQEWVESLQEVSDAVDEAKDAVEAWTCAEGREEKADTKEDALEALERLVSAWNSSPLDLSILEDWEGGDE